MVGALMTLADPEPISVFLQADEVVREFGHRLVSRLGVLLHAPLDDGLEKRGHVVPERRDALRCLVDDRVEHSVLIVGGERTLPRDHLVERHAERPDVGPVIDPPAARLLRRHVGHRADRRALSRSARLTGERRQAEVEDLGPAVLCDEDVGGLDVAVDDAPAVRLGEAPCDPEPELRDVGELERTPLHPFLECLALVAGHGDEEPAVVRLVDVVDGADVRVIERRRGARLLDEALLGVLVPRQLGGEELEGDGPLEAGVLGAVHDTHAALTELLANHVV